MVTILAFVVALALLIAVHEYGHYRVAVACGVKVLRFSVGFGKTLLRWQPKGSPTEFVIAMFPLGGYVRMLDEREAPVPPHERHLAFNNQSWQCVQPLLRPGLWSTCCWRWSCMRWSTGAVFSRPARYLRAQLLAPLRTKQD
jgi:membrane-associated protease RseP (regulator of RpoE activity)